MELTSETVPGLFFVGNFFVIDFISLLIMVLVRVFNSWSILVGIHDYEMFKTLCWNIKFRVIKSVYLRRWKEWADKLNNRADSFLWSSGQGQVLLRWPRPPSGPLWPPSLWSATFSTSTPSTKRVPISPGQGLCNNCMEAKYPILRPDTNFSCILEMLRFPLSPSMGFWGQWGQHKQASKFPREPVSCAIPTPNSAGLGWPWNPHFHRSPCDSVAGFLNCTWMYKYIHLCLPTDWPYRIQSKLQPPKCLFFMKFSLSTFFFLWFLMALVT